ncbi:hypothetical protein PVAND_014639 [Polypedilum vanderplanki]|uniref:Metalloendopeptidase n=1 Tax=Polypedilum vanderplanki TaxID=319348 RepID=A0A9J6BAB1_POLVA|nr:hypothetical protein PVAND_014639 [Polypedilum vanderplanki]
MIWLLLFLNLLLFQFEGFFAIIKVETEIGSFGGDRGQIDDEDHDYFADEMTIYDPNTEMMLDDMIITHQEFKRFFIEEDEIETKRNAITDENSYWPDKTVRYFMDREFYDVDKKIIREGIKMITDVSCIKFNELSKPPNDSGPYIHINSGNGCYSKVGADCKKCIMSLSITGCLRPGTVAHEFLHSLGFYHMQCSKGRDNFVDIIWSNMKNNAEKNFFELGTVSSLLNTTYDYDSILHYGPRFFSVNGAPTIIPKDGRYLSRIGQREFLSQGDIDRLNIRYKCYEN